MGYQDVIAAFAAESGQLAVVAAETADAAFRRPSPCPPWTAGELFWHTQNSMTRVRGMLAEPEPEPSGFCLVPARGYYRAGQRFSAAVNADRIAAAQRGAAAAAPGAAARARDFAVVRDETLRLLRRTPASRPVRTRHGDRMLLGEFARTRVLELAVHGLDLAIALGRPPWMTGQAAQVVQDLLLPREPAAALRAGTGWDQVTLVAKLTGRSRPTATEEQAIGSAGFPPLALG